jgi:hypothetical protein
VESQYFKNANPTGVRKHMPAIICAVVLVQVIAVLLLSSAPQFMVDKVRFNPLIMDEYEAALSEKGNLSVFGYIQLSNLAKQRHTDAEVESKSDFYNLILSEYMRRCNRSDQYIRLYERAISDDDRITESEFRTLKEVFGVSIRRCLQSEFPYPIN